MFIRIHLNENVTHTGSHLTAGKNGDVFVNFNQMSHISFGESRIDYCFGADGEVGAPGALEFSQDGMGEYQRIKREFEELISRQGGIKPSTIKELTNKLEALANRIAEPSSV